MIAGASPKSILVTIGDASRITGLGNTKICNLIIRGQLKNVAVGRRRLVLNSSVELLKLFAA